MRGISRVLWIALAVTLPVALLVFCFRQIDIGAVWHDLGQVRVGYVLAALVSMLALIVIIPVEWKLFVPPGKHVSFGALLRIVTTMIMLQNTLHHVAGHVFAIFQLGSRQRLSKSVALSILATDQLAEGLARLFFWGLIASFIELPTWALDGLRGVLTLVGTFYAVLLAFAWTHRDQPVPIATENPTLWQRGYRHLAEWAHHLRGIRDLRITLAAVSLAITKKLLRALTVYFVQCSLGVELPFTAPLLVVGSA